MTTPWDVAAQEVNRYEVSPNIVDPRIRRAAYIGATWFTRTFPERYWWAKDKFGGYIDGHAPLKSLFVFGIKWFSGAPAQLISGSGAKGAWDIWIAANVTSEEFAACAAAHETYHCAFDGNERNAYLVGRAAARYYRDGAQFKFVLGGANSVDAKMAAVAPGSYLLTFENGNELQCYCDQRKARSTEQPVWRSVTLG